VTESERLLRSISSLGSLVSPKSNNLCVGCPSTWSAAVADKVARGGAVYLAAGYALSRSRDCAIDERLGAEAPDHDPMHRTGLLGANDRRCDAPE